MPSLAHGIEYAPTSVALAETQAMFFDHFLKNPEWIARYPQTKAGDPIPDDLVREIAQAVHDWEVFSIRQMLVVPFFERRLYRLPDKKLTPENIARIAREEENECSLVQPLALFYQ